MAKEFGSQAIVVSIEAKEKEKRLGGLYWSGREQTGIDVEDWVKKISDLGWRNFNNFYRSRRHRKRFDQQLLSVVTKNTSVPIIASGGFGKLKDVDLGFISPS